MPLWKLLLFLQPVAGVFVSSVEDYLAKRNALIANETESFYGAEVVLTDLEKAANASLMYFKHLELNQGFKDPSSYSPSISFLNARSNITKSSVYQFIQKLPKGGALHTHDLSLASASWVVSNITYQDHLYVSGYPDFPHFRWRLSPPKDGRNWTLISDLRTSISAKVVDDWLLRHLDLTVKDPLKSYSNIDKVWEAFMGVMMATQDLISYAPIYDQYMYQGLTEFKKDGVSYIEIRTVFPETICKDLSCTKVLSTLQVAKLNQKTINRFLSKNPNFCGVTLIYAPVRAVNRRTVHMKYLNRLRKLRHYFPDLVRGFDLVGQEDKGNPLIKFIKTLLQMKKMDEGLNFVFHAGETDWLGTSTDENLFDAVLLNASRIGHGYALLKHPILKSLVKTKDIAIEICPISNQVLGLLKDLRNHPGSPLFVEGDIPIVISSDDPGSWGAQGVSYDLYEAFMGLASRDMDLRFLKKLISNSIEYSLLRTSEKERCRKKFDMQWYNAIRRIYSK